MNETTLSKMKHMKFYGMYQAFTSTIETGKSEDFTFDQLIAHLIDAEWDDRHNRKIERNIKNARFRYKAQIEKVIYNTHRNIDKNMLLRLAQCEYIKRGETLLITGSTGAGKSYIASALGYQACIEGFRVMYFNLAKLFARLKMAKADGSYLKELGKMERQHLLIFDDFGLQPMDHQSRLALLEIIEDRHEKGAIIITSQLPVSKWYEIIGEKTVADAIMDRLVHQSHRIEIGGESMRRKRINNNEEILNKFTSMK